MSHATSRPTLLNACLDAISRSERIYSRWSGGLTMRSAPESLVQYQIAERLAKHGDIVVLEASVTDIIAVSNEMALPDVSRSDRGRIDIAVFYKSKGKRAFPRFVIEVKKLTTHHSLDEDHKRIEQILDTCPQVQNGVMVGYGTALTMETVMRKVEVVTQHLRCKRVKTLAPIEVTGRDGRPRFLAAGVFRVDRKK